jgi:flagellar protein FlaG
MDINPLSGVNNVPVVAPTPPSPEQVAENRQIVQAVKAVNQAGMLGENNELTFSLDRQTKQPVIQIIDRSTKEVIQQIPPEYVLQVAQDLNHG